MSIRNILEGEGRLFGAIGANLGLGWLKQATVVKLSPFMPFLEQLLTVAQIAVALATLVYMALKIRRVITVHKDG